jgi:hypothetical protein
VGVGICDEWCGWECIYATYHLKEEARRLQSPDMIAPELSISWKMRTFVGYMCVFLCVFLCVCQRCLVRVVNNHRASSISWK